MEFRCRVGTAAGRGRRGCVRRRQRVPSPPRPGGEGAVGARAASERAVRARRPVPVAAAAPADPDARVPGVQPGTGDAAEGGDAAGAVARSAAAARAEPVVPQRAERRLREGESRHGAVGGLRRARGSVSARLHGLAAGGGAERRSRLRAAALRVVLEDHRDDQAQDGVGAGLPGHPGLPVHRAGRDHRAEGGAGVLGVLRVVRIAAAAGDARDRPRVGHPPASVRCCWSAPS